MVHFIASYVLEFFAKLGHFVVFFRGTEAGLQRAVENFPVSTLKEWKSSCNVFAEISQRMSAFFVHAANA